MCSTITNTIGPGDGRSSIWSMNGRFEVETRGEVMNLSGLDKNNLAGDQTMSALGD